MKPKYTDILSQSGSELLAVNAYTIGKAYLRTISSQTTIIIKYPYSYF